jgi:aquaporin Z
MKAQWQKYLAEFFGTFTLVFIGSAAVVGVFRLTGADPTSPNFKLFALLTAPFAFGIALLAGLYAFAETSGGHFNPAVSLAMFLDRRLSVIDLVGYGIFQFAGAIFASGLLYAAFEKASVKATATAPGQGRGVAVVFEIVLTAVFVLVILQVTKSSSFGSSALIAIPLTLLGIHFAAILFSGSSVNPARTLGPAVIGNTWTSIWIYFLGPAAGAILGWLIHTIVVEGDVDIRDNVAAVVEQVEDEIEGGGAAVSDDQPAPEAPEWGTETNAEVEAEGDDKT